MGRSTGWVTEALLLALVVLLLAGVGDIAARYGLEALGGTASQLLEIGLGLAAVVTARRRELAKRDALAAVDGSAGA